MDDTPPTMSGKCRTDKFFSDPQPLVFSVVGYVQSWFQFLYVSNHDLLHIARQNSVMLRSLYQGFWKRLSVSALLRVSELRLVIAVYFQNLRCTPPTIYARVNSYGITLAADYCVRDNISLSL